MTDSRHHSVLAGKDLPKRLARTTEADVLITEVLNSRPTREPDVAAENRVLCTLAQHLTDEPQSLLKKLVQRAKDLCGADTVGVSLLEAQPNGNSVFRWVAIAGELAALEQTTTSADFSPCGTTLRLRQPQLYTYPERYFDYLQQPQHTIVEALLLPLYITDQPLGALWMLSHTQQRQFEREDQRLLTNLAGFATAALQQMQVRQATKVRLGQLKTKTVSSAIPTIAAFGECKQTEEALRESEELKQSILESSQDCIKVLTLSSEIIYISNGGLRLLEVDNPQSVLNTVWVNCWQGQDHEQAKAAIADAIRGNIGQFQGYLPTRKGTPKWWDSIITPVHDAAGRVVQLAAISRDITERKQIEAERESLLVREKAAREAAERANQMKDEFLAVLSHELRSPLNPILGWAKLLQKQNLDPAITKRALQTIERNAKLQAQLVDDLLDVSRILQGQLRLKIAPVDLAATVTAALETVQLAAAAKTIQIQTVLEPDVGQILGDSGRLQQIVWHLLSNAVKFTPEGGRVEIRLEKIDGEQGNQGARVTGNEGIRESGSQGTRESEGKAAIHPFSHPSTHSSTHPPIHRPITPSPHPSYAQITVSDTGQGISSEFLSYLFDYFRQADSAITRQFGGLGLGLAIVRQIVELHGGTVHAASTGEGQGATFTVKFPLMPQQASQPQPAQQDGLEPTVGLHNVKVLVVEDMTDTREYVTFVLEQEGAEVVAIASASEALPVLAEFKPAVVVSDIGMPQMDGHLFMQHVRQLAPDQGGQTPAIALTAYVGELNQQQAAASGFQKHLAKPIEPGALVNAVAALVK